MSLQQLKEKACKLSVSDRLALLGASVQSLQSTPEIENWQYLTAPPPAKFNKKFNTAATKTAASSVYLTCI
ncbi:hypothetical protein QUA27_23260 [Microcoleus sp. Pol14C6]|uniref:hypothetical protein n=1 Tax=unclassified Microcoleus TaxID=2642155 RepID=UPI002FD38046